MFGWERFCTLGIQLKHSTCQANPAHLGTAHADYYDLSLLRWLLSLLWWLFERLTGGSQVEWRPAIPTSFPRHGESVHMCAQARFLVKSHYTRSLWFMLTLERGSVLFGRRTLDCLFKYSCSNTSVVLCRSSMSRRLLALHPRHIRDQILTTCRIKSRWIKICVPHWSPEPFRPRLRRPYITPTFTITVTYILTDMLSI